MFKKCPPYLSHTEDFRVLSYDTYHMQAIKLEISSLIATESFIYIILPEFQGYIRNPDGKFAVDSVAANKCCVKT